MVMLLNKEFKQVLLKAITSRTIPDEITRETFAEIINSIKLDGFSSAEQTQKGLVYKNATDETKTLHIEEVPYTTTRPFISELTTSFTSGKSLDINHWDEKFLAKTTYCSKFLKMNDIQNNLDLRDNVCEITTLIYLVSLPPFLLTKSAS